MENQNSPKNTGFIFVHHIRACGLCTIKSRRFLLDHGWSNQQVQDFFKNGMPVEEFERQFGNDAMARLVVEKAKKNG